MTQADTGQYRFFFYRVLVAHAPPASLSWLDDKTEKLRKSFVEREFYLTFSLLPRYFSKEKIHLTTELKEEAKRLLAGFCPGDFSILQCARIFLALLIPHDDQKRFQSVLNTLFTTGEVGEQAALYSALALMPYPASLQNRAAEGIRSNITVIFDAIALHNPYPAHYLSEDAWNQMVLKAVFIERPLWKIYGLDERANKKLAYMLSDYAHERWAASRPVTPELWRPVAPFLDSLLLNDVKRLLEQGSPLEKQAAALALLSAKFPEAKALIKDELKQEVEQKKITWQHIAEQWLKEKMNPSTVG
ncbi:MAG: hypothetical protein KatS3mg031_2029 [Chitinophagales bacterium]|nr:MAG: hypothetical protein KatS3mg031_2029 [Chitinophagales bacterium]